MNGLTPSSSRSIGRAEQFTFVFQINMESEEWAALALSGQSASSASEDRRRAILEFVAFLRSHNPRSFRDEFVGQQFMTRSLAWIKGLCGCNKT